MEGNFQERIEELLVCNICFECFISPKTLSCHHTFCCYCLVRHAVESNWNLRCPSCRQEQSDIKSEHDINLLDAPLYIKQALDVVQHYRQHDIDCKPPDYDEVTSSDPPEHCFVCNEDGHWQNSCPNHADSTCYPDYEKLYVDYPRDDDDDDVNCPKDGLDLVDCCDTVEVEEEGKMPMFTQEFTFGKLCNKMFKKMYKNKEEKTQRSNTAVAVPVVPCSSETAVVPRKTTTTVATNDGKQLSSTNTNRGSTVAHNKLAYRHKYVPGTLTRTRPIHAMMGMGLGLSGQHGSSKHNNTLGIPSQFSMRQTGPSSSSATRPTYSSAPRKNNERSGQFGACPFLLPCPRKKKIIFAFKI